MAVVLNVLSCTSENQAIRTAAEHAGLCGQIVRLTGQHGRAWPGSLTATLVPHAAAAAAAAEAEVVFPAAAAAAAAAAAGNRESTATGLKLDTSLLELPDNCALLQVRTRCRTLIESESVVVWTSSA